MTDSRLFELIAQCWCKPNTEHIVMEPELAKEFQKLIASETRRAREQAIRECAEVVYLINHKIGHQSAHTNRCGCDEYREGVLKLLSPKESEEKSK